MVYQTEKQLKEFADKVGAGWAGRRRGMLAVQWGRAGWA